MGEGVDSDCFSKQLHMPVTQLCSVLGLETDSGPCRSRFAEGGRRGSNEQNAIKLQSVPKETASRAAGPRIWPSPSSIRYHIDEMPQELISCSIH